MSSRFDFSAAYAGLKDFQARTVDYVFERMYLDDHPTRRFLVADEVGLGKTLVARGLIGRTAEHLDRQGVERIDIIYICSNAEIARQNIRRLSLPGFENSAFSSRLTLLPLELHNLTNSRLNFVAFTPGTALDLKANLGRVDERVVLYWLLKKKWPDLVGTKRGPLRVFQGGVASLSRFEGRVRRMKGKLRRIDKTLRQGFSTNIDRHDEQARLRGEPGLGERFEYLASEWAHKRSARSWSERHERNVFVGDLRNLLAKTCVEALEPDLVILDEFQRFRHVLDPDTEAGELARSLFDYTDHDTETRALLLSATPYKMYTLKGESADDDHYTDFLETTRFLMNGEVGDFETDLSEFSRQLMNIEPDHLEPLLERKRRIEKSLSRVMCRTERLASNADRNGMLREVASHEFSIETKDFINYITLDRVSAELDAQSMMEYWKSAPYFPNFWDTYQVGRKYERALEEDPSKAANVQFLLRDSDTLLPWSDLKQYQMIDPGNGRIRSLAHELLEEDETWKLLWLPPSLPYYQLAGPFKGATDKNLTKRLVFSAWTVVPKVVSTILSYEAERRMMTSRKKKNLENSPEGRERFTEPLRFPKSRPSGMSAFAFIYPSPALAELADPLWLTQELRTQGRKPTRRAVLSLAQSKITEALEEAIPGTTELIEGADDRWYWVAPLILDSAHQTQNEWVSRRELAEVWTGSEGRGAGVGFQAHLDEAQAVAEQARDGTLRMGARPENLGRVLALLALGAPGTVAYRSLGRLERAETSEMERRDASARIAWGFRSLFNVPEVTQLVRGQYRSGPYWQRALKYSVDGCLQSTLDEYAHVLREFEGIVGEMQAEDLKRLGESVEDVVSLRSSDLHAHDPLDVDTPTRRMRCRFALPFGQYRSEEQSQVRRSGYVRTAFNSPFWPFVLTTTSVGQEGLDFHLYCHAVVHWNLPANPVDLEQREGRVHRYMGHALRKNLANAHWAEGLNGGTRNPWTSILEVATESRSPDETDLVPFWIFPGDSKIERHVPRIPLSREEGRLVDLRRSLALYRIVFGQPRQEELIDLIQGRLGPGADAQEIIDGLRIDLSPLRTDQLHQSCQLGP